MKDILIRAMRPEDAVAVNQLSGQLGYPHTLAETGERMRLMLPDANNHLLVAVVTEEVVGWIHVSKVLLLESGAFAEIAALVVDEKYRGNGVGEQLVSAAKVWCAGETVLRLRVRSNVLRTRAHQFYLRAGFRELKESKVFELNL